MSKKLQSLIDDLSNQKISEIEFVERYQSAWRAERDSGAMLEYGERLSEVFSTIFCLADLFNPEDDRLEYEYGEEELRRKITELIGVLGRSQ